MWIQQYGIAERVILTFPTVDVCRHRRSGWGSVDPPIRSDNTTFIRANDNTFVWLTVSPNGTSIHLPEIHSRWCNKGNVHRVLFFYRQTVGSAIVHYYFFLPGGAAWQTVCVRNSGKTRFDPLNGCWPIRLCMPATLDRQRPSLGNTCQSVEIVTLLVNYFLCLKFCFCRVNY